MNEIIKIDNKIALFEGKEIRKTFCKNEWWFVVVDVVEVLTLSKNPSGYIKDMRRRDEELSKGWGQIATPPFQYKQLDENKNLIVQTQNEVASFCFVKSLNFHIMIFSF